MITPEQRKELDEIIKDDPRYWELSFELPDGVSHKEIFYGCEDAAVDKLNDLLEEHGIKLRVFPAEEPEWA
jgi:hypothetical protein